METTEVPANPLIDQQTVDTLVHVQSVLAVLQDYITQEANQDSITAGEAQINTGHYVVLKLVSEALDFEIERLGEMGMDRMVQ